MLNPGSALFTSPLTSLGHRTGEGPVNADCQTLESGEPLRTPFSRWISYLAIGEMVHELDLSVMMCQPRKSQGDKSLKHSICRSKQIPK